MCQPSCQVPFSMGGIDISVRPLTGQIACLAALVAILAGSASSSTFADLRPEIALAQPRTEPERQRHSMVRLPTVDEPAESRDPPEGEPRGWIQRVSWQAPTPPTELADPPPGELSESQSIGERPQDNSLLRARPMAV
jgi:hypothetical protein